MIQLRSISRHYESEGRPVAALDAVSVDIGDGTFTAVTGPSGCGKSTLLHLLAALDRPDAGEIEVAGVRLDLAGEAEHLANEEVLPGNPNIFSQLVGLFAPAQS